MNLYDLMGPMAVSAGAGVLYGLEHSHGAAFWASLLGGGVVGWAAFLRLRRVALRKRERSLTAIFIATPVCVLTATIVGAWMIRALV